MSYENPINDAIGTNTQEPIVAVGYSPKRRMLADEIVALVASVNAQVLPERSVSLSSAAEVARRSLASTASSVFYPEWRLTVAMRAVNDFVNASAFGKPFKVVNNSDLLYPGNPLSSVVASASISAEQLAEARAEWFAADARIDEEYRPLVASAYLAERGSVDEKFSLAILESMDSSLVPKDVVLNILNK